MVIDRDAFLDALERVKTVVKQKSTLPILSNVLVDFSPAIVTLCATDLELSVIVSIPGTYDLPEVHTLLFPGALLHDVLARMKEGDVVISFLAGDIVELIQDTYRVTFPLILRDDYPKVTREPGEGAFTIDGSALSKAINKVLYAVSKDETRYVLTGMAMQITDEWLYTIGTDGFRISVYKTPAEGAYDTALLILPKRSAKLVSELMDGDYPVQLTVIRNERAERVSVCFDAPNLLIRSRIINQVYPEWANVLSFEGVNEEKLCSLSTSYMAECLDRVGVIGNKEATKMTVTPNRVDFDISSGLANASSWVPAVSTVEEVVHHVVVGQMVDAVAHIGTDRVDMEVPATYGMIKFIEKPEKDMPPRHIEGVMPWRV
jgi:DNA polymerase-3 subunit beta